MGDLLQPWHLMVLSVVGCFFLFFLLLPAVFYILTLTRALNKCSSSSKTIEPGMLWLLLVPFVNIVWHFFVVLGMAKSLNNEFRLRNMQLADPMPGQSIGIAMCICGTCSIIPLLGVVAGLAFLVLWIVYWAKIAEFSRLLDQASMANATPNASIGV
jgi:hypothetical protein